LAEEDPAAYRNIMQLSRTKFDDLLKVITPAITKINIPVRNAIPSKTKLALTLRYLASGDNPMTRVFIPSSSQYNTIPYAS